MAASFKTLPRNVKERILQYLELSDDYDTIMELEPISEDWNDATLYNRWSYYLYSYRPGEEEEEEEDFDQEIDMDTDNNVFTPPPDIQELLQVGHRFIHYMTIEEDSCKALNSFSGLRFPMLRTIDLHYSAENIKEIGVLLKNNPAVDKLTITFDYSQDFKNRPFPIMDYITPSPGNSRGDGFGQLTELVLSKVTIVLSEGFTKLLENLPNIKNLRLGDIIVGDVGDIIFFSEPDHVMAATTTTTMMMVDDDDDNGNSNNYSHGRSGSFPNVREFAMSNLYIPNQLFPKPPLSSENEEAEAAVFDIGRVFPNLRSLTLNREYTEAEGLENPDLVGLGAGTGSNTTTSVGTNSGAVAFSYYNFGINIPTLQSLEIIDMDISLAKKVGKSCPGLKRLVFKSAYNNDQYQEIQRMMKILFEGLPKIEAFNLTLDKLVDQNPLVATNIPIPTQQQTQVPSSTSTANIDLSAISPITRALNPIISNWKNLRELFIFNNKGVSPTILLVLSKLLNLEKLTFWIKTLDGIKDIRQAVCNPPSNKSSNNNNNNKLLLSSSSSTTSPNPPTLNVLPFPNLIDLLLVMTQVEHTTVQEGIEFFTMFPALKWTLVVTPPRFGHPWENALLKQQFPKISFHIKPDIP